MKPHPSETEQHPASDLDPKFLYAYVASWVSLSSSADIVESLFHNDDELDDFGNRSLGDSYSEAAP